MYRSGSHGIQRLRTVGRLRASVISQKAWVSSAGQFKIPKPFNEPNVGFRTLHFPDN